MYAIIKNDQISSVVTKPLKGATCVGWPSHADVSRLEDYAYRDGKIVEAVPVKERAKQKIEALRDAAFDAGVPYTFGEEEDSIQTRFQDKINLLGLRIEARELLDSGVTEAVIPFRALSNVDRLLTPAEVVDLTNTALGYIQLVYQKSWTLKDAVENAADEDVDVAAIEW